MTRRRGGRLITPALRLYGLLIRAYPAGFRRQFGAQLVQVFRDGCWDAVGRAGNTALVRWWLLALWDLARTVVGERRVERATRRQPMKNGDPVFTSETARTVATEKSVTSLAGRQLRWMLWRLIAVGLLWGVLVQGFREYGPGVPILGRVDFVWLEVLALVVLLAGLARRAPGWSAASMGLLVAVFGISVLVGHYGYYAGALALGAGQAAHIDMDLADPGAYRFLWDVFSSGIARWLLLVELGGFGIGWVWGTLLRRRRQPPHPVPAGRAG